MLLIQLLYLVIMILGPANQNVLIIIPTHKFKRLIEFVLLVVYKLQHYFMQTTSQKFVESPVHALQSIMDKMILNYVSRNAQIQLMASKIQMLESVLLNVLAQP